MIITGVHWFVATTVAVAVHLAGMLWLSVASPERQPEVESASEGIVVTLGRDARIAAETPDAPEPETDAAVAAMAEPEPPQPDAASDAEQPVSEEPVPREPDADLASVEPDTAPTPDASATESVKPDTVEARQMDEAAALEPDTAKTPEVPETAEPGTVEPETAEAGQVADVSSEEAPVVASEAVPGSDPDDTETVAVEEAPSRPEPTVESAEAPEIIVAEPAEEEIQSHDAVPTELADDAAVREPAERPATVREVETADAGTSPAPETPADDAARSAPAAPVEDLEAAPADQISPRAVSESVEPPVPGGDTTVDVAAARQPVPDVQQMSEPEVTETTAPETVKLEELQERSGGAGVVARYAGVLKGWLQKNMHYPRAARLAGEEGEVVVRFVIDREGNVQSVELEAGSGHSLLDREATEMVERGNPFPAMPGDMPGERLEVRVPVSFEVRDETRDKDLPPIYLE